MNVILQVVWTVVINYAHNIWHVETTPGNRRSDHNSENPGFKLVEREVSVDLIFAYYVNKVKFYNNIYICMVASYGYFSINIKSLTNNRSRCHSQHVTMI